MTGRIVRIVLACFCIAVLAGAAPAKDAKRTPAPQSPPAQSYVPASDPYAEILRGGVHGPSQVTLSDQAKLDLPAGYVYLPEKPAREVMKAFGNAADESFLGLVFPEMPEGWFVTMDYMASGYIKDDDAKNWNADDMLASVKEGTDADNARRAAEGVGELEIVGWVEKPHYDEATHRLVWSIAARDKGAAASGQDSINYRTLMLGRQGYVAMVMVTDAAAIEQQKPIANLLLSKLTFVGGKGYADFDSSTDTVAAFGLGALIAGIAVKKLGLFALIAAFVVKFAKVIAIGAIAGAAGLRRFFVRAKPATAAATTMAGSVQPPRDSTPA